MSATSPVRSDSIGRRLRNIRQQQGMSLAEVQERSNGCWKAVVIGAYERGDRSISISRLASLARFYDVPLAELLPANRAEQKRAGQEKQHRRVSSDVHARLYRQPLRRPRVPEVAAVSRFVRRVQVRRGDFNGTMITLRDGDLSTIAVAIGREDNELIGILE